MRVVIIGNGVAGATAALELRRRDPQAEIVMVSGESPFHFSRPALMYIFMGHLRERDTRPFEDHVWDAKRIRRVQAWVTGIDTSAARVELDRGEPLSFDRLVLATGSEPNRFGWPGQDLERVQGMVSLQDLERLERSMDGLRHAVIVGGGLIGVELAEMLHSRGVRVTMLVREPAYWANVLPLDEARLVGRVIAEAGIEVRLETELAEILGDARGRAVGVTLTDGERLECQLVGLTAGVHPNLGAVQGSEVATGRGILVDHRFRTNVENVYAIGDCAELVSPDDGPNVVEQLWYTGRMHGEVLADALTGGARSYERGVWFNSAKFLDLEFQTYGRVSGAHGPRAHEAERTLFWQHPEAPHTLRIAMVDDRVVGFDALGLRLRHRVCERWITEERRAEQVLEHLAEANFDPELYRHHEQAIVGTMKEQLS